MTTELRTKVRALVNEHYKPQSAHGILVCERWEKAIHALIASELSALQKEGAELRQLNSGLVEECANYRGLLYGCDEHKLWNGLSCIGCIEAEREALQKEVEKLNAELTAERVLVKSLREQATAV